MAEKPRAVYDCMIFLQSAINPNGPAFRCLEAVEGGQVRLFVCPGVIAEVYDVLNRPRLRSRFRRLSSVKTAEFLRRVVEISEYEKDPPRLCALPRDPTDEVYLNLALEVSADFLVTWNVRHLTYLMDSSEPEAIDFRRRFPHLRIVDPPALLQVI